MKSINRAMLYAIICVLIFVSCNTSVKEKLRLSEQMANSAITRNPEAWMLDFSSSPKWGYCHGVVGKAMLELYEEYGDEKYYKYIEAFTDTMVFENGEIYGYTLSEYNIDKINSGKLLFGVYNKNNKRKYLEAINLLRNQLGSHPKTQEGGFWHKKIYVHQMWLDGVYMSTPFYAQYCKEFNDTAGFKDIRNQFMLVRKHLYDPATGLYRHGWDESHSQRWSDSITGQSAYVWGRGVGWFYMALVDVLDFYPEDHFGYDEILNIYKELSTAIVKYQDTNTGVWYQVMDLPHKEGNYLESTCSVMFVYGLLKGIRKGYLENSFSDPAIKAYNGILKQFIKNENGNLTITNCCAGAGLGGNPYRDGSYEYYINEEVRNNDPKAVGPFIMASIEFEKLSAN